MEVGPSSGAKLSISMEKSLQETQTAASSKSSKTTGEASLKSKGLIPERGPLLTLPSAFKKLTPINKSL